MQTVGFVAYGEDSTAKPVVHCLGIPNDALLEKIKNYADEMKSEVVAKDAKLKEVGYKAY